MNEVPNTVSYILNKTNQSSLNCIALGVSATIIHASLSLNHNLNLQIKNTYAINPLLNTTGKQAHNI